MKNAFKLNSNLPPLSLSLKGGEQKRGLFKDHNSQSAFTLVELAIVVVVLGILIGGIVAGQSIIESANANKTISQIGQMKTAIQAYKLEFDALPGDHKDAYEYFGDECGENNIEKSVGCNGNGDKCITGNNICTDTFSDRSYSFGEMRKIFVHLNLSGIMPDVLYDSDATDNNCGMGIHAPESNLDGGFVVYTNRANKIYLNYFKADTSHNGWACRFNNIRGTTTPKIAKRIDTKLDNENGMLGIVQAIHNFGLLTGDGRYSAPECMNWDGIYDLSKNDGDECGIRINLQ
jgi:prepilin-type N-terminal cleavage/methylation domain-containing protein